ncbi:hypothetical protein OG535_38920 [Kitasatospora sp. NBC_00085]|uniref:hypothetical protein n=1 Tax=unclassified Kitasatospora TaxID=2633591 RepID=UPI0032568941
MANVALLQITGRKVEVRPASRADLRVPRNHTCTSGQGSAFSEVGLLEVGLRERFTTAGSGRHGARRDAGVRDAPQDPRGGDGRARRRRWP